MKAEIKEKNGVSIIELEGNIDYEAADLFKDKLKGFLNKKKETNSNNIIINMERLNFVGSIGLTEFISMMKNFNTEHPNLKYCGVKSEFKRLIKAYADEDDFAIFDSEDHAVNSFDI